MTISAYNVDVVIYTACVVDTVIETWGIMANEEHFFFCFFPDILYCRVTLHLCNFSLVTYLFPLCFIGLHIAMSPEVFNYRDSPRLLANLGLLLAGAVLAFFLEFSEFLLVAQTSSLTLSISGIFKVRSLWSASGGRHFRGDKPLTRPTFLH